MVFGTARRELLCDDRRGDGAARGLRVSCAADRILTADFTAVDCWTLCWSLVMRKECLLGLHTVPGFVFPISNCFCDAFRFFAVSGSCLVGP